MTLDKCKIVYLARNNPAHLIANAIFIEEIA